jgi:23S rRNA C2498 (ribose-2'-O)-methylase RlmM
LKVKDAKVAELAAAPDLGAVLGGFAWFCKKGHLAFTSIIIN